MVIDLYRKYMDTLARQTDDAVADVEPVGRDPEFIEKLTPLMNIYRRYFDTEVRGLEKLPTDRAFLLVGNHSGGMFTPDASALLAAWFTDRGADVPLTGLAFNLAFALKPIGDFFRRIGEVPASSANAERSLDRGTPVLVYPGGDHEVYRPYRDRNRVDFDDRKGFIRLAMKKQVEIYPLVGHGAHNSLIVITRGERLARALQFDKVRSKIFPIVLTPLGPMPAWLVPVPPMPAKIVMQVLDPVDLGKYEPEDADDTQLVDRIFDEITTAMQGALDELAGEFPHPVAHRIKTALGL